MATAFLRNSLRSRARATLAGALLAVAAASIPLGAAQDTRAPDHDAIALVLENYRSAVTRGDEALFLTTLLDDQIPFHAVRDASSPQTSLNSQQTRGATEFLRSVFHSGRRYQQRFDDVRIQQDGTLAQATLRFVTQRDDGSGGAGWKTLTLVNVGGQWKIASEFYTVRSLTAADVPAAPKP